MADLYEVTCVDARDAQGAHERISHIGGMSWKMTQEEAIAAIEAGMRSFYVTIGGRPVWLMIAVKWLRKSERGG